MPTINKPKKKQSDNMNKITSQKYVYNTDRWYKLRLLKLMNNPLCEICIGIDKVESATQVHHLTPFMLGNSIEQIQWLGFDYNNLQSICDECHRNIHHKK